MFIAQIYKFTVGAIINRPKKFCAIYAGEQCSPLQEKTFNRAVCDGFSPLPSFARLFAAQNPPSPSGDGLLNRKFVRYTTIYRDALKKAEHRLKTALYPQIKWTRGKSYAASTDLFVIKERLAFTTIYLDALKRHSTD